MNDVCFLCLLGSMEANQPVLCSYENTDSSGESCPEAFSEVVWEYKETFQVYGGGAECHGVWYFLIQG